MKAFSILVILGCCMSSHLLLASAEGTQYGKHELDSRTGPPAGQFSGASESDLPQDKNLPGDKPPKIYRLHAAGTAPDTVTLFIADNGEPLLRKRYGSSGITFNSVTLRDAQKLWHGKGSRQQQSLKLWGSNGINENEFRIELRFKNGFCSEYRVEGPGITDTAWKGSLMQSRPESSTKWTDPRKIDN